MSPHILALDVAGAPHRWINVRDAAPAPGTRLLMLSAVVLLAVWRKSRKGEPAAAAC